MIYIPILVFVLAMVNMVIYLFFKPNDPYRALGTYKAKGILQSISERGKGIFSVYLCYPRFIHAELMTHKDFSRSASSSRAIPVMKMLKQVWNNPATPVAWGANMPGMQAKEELKGWRATVARNTWALAGKVMCIFAWIMMKVGLHKQVANRLLEPWQMIHVVVTSTEWNNFFNLRIHADAQPEIRWLAERIKAAKESTPTEKLKEGQWHLPWIEEQDWMMAWQYFEEQSRTEASEEKVVEILKKQSAARCARTSYATFDGKRSTIEADLVLFNQLVTSKPVHASPCEHQAKPDTQSMYCTYVKDKDGHYGRVAEKMEWDNPELHGNLQGWIQFRRMIPGHYIQG